MQFGRKVFEEVITAGKVRRYCWSSFRNDMYSDPHEYMCGWA
jgi:hypothetical protein